MARKKQSGLGKGLDSLIPDFYNEDFDSNSSISLEDMLKDDKSIDDISEENSNVEEIEETIDQNDSLVEDDSIDDNNQEENEEEIVEDNSPVDEEIDDEISNMEEETVDSEDDDKNEDLEIDDETSIVESEMDNVEDEETSEELVEEVVEEEIVLTERDIANIDEVKEIVAKNPRITLWSAQSAAVFRYLRKTEPEFSISKEASLIIEEAVSKKYPDIWKLFEED